MALNPRLRRCWVIHDSRLFEIPPEPPFKKGGSAVSAEPFFSKGEPLSPPFLKGDSGGFIGVITQFKIRKRAGRRRNKHE